MALLCAFPALWVGKQISKLSFHFKIQLYPDLLFFFTPGKAAVLMLRARALKKARATAKAAAKAAKAAAEAAATSGNPDVIVTSSNINDTGSLDKPEVDSLTFGHQRAIVAVATLIQVGNVKKKSKIKTRHISLKRM